MFCAEKGKFFVRRNPFVRAVSGKREELFQNPRKTPGLNKDSARSIFFSVPFESRYRGHATRGYALNVDAGMRKFETLRVQSFEFEEVGTVDAMRSEIRFGPFGLKIADGRLRDLR